MEPDTDMDDTFKVPTFATEAKRLVVRLARFTMDTTFRVPTLAVGVTRDDVFEIPDTFKDVSVPTDVMLGWDGWDTTSATFALETFPETEDP